MPKGKGTYGSKRGRPKKSKDSTKKELKNIENRLKAINNFESDQIRQTKLFHNNILRFQKKAANERNRLLIKHKSILKQNPSKKFRR